MTSPTAPAEPVPVAFLGRTSTLVMQDPIASLRRQLRACQAKLPPGWFLAAHYWDIESGGLDIEARGHGTSHQGLDVGIPRDGGLAALLAEAASPVPRFAAVVCEDIERSGRDTFNALKLERQLGDAGIPLFATDEPINVEGMNATTILVRRVKQGVAEWYRLQIKEKAWAGLREHSLAGWNIGSAPYGYTAEKVPHPVPAKRAEGRTKTRLALDAARAPVVACIFAWRVDDRLGLPTITARLNADHTTCPPPKGDAWTEMGVYALLANPKYTGHMVWNRTAKTGGRRRINPPEQWVWTPEPSHPAIISRATYDAAQQVGAERGNIRDDPGPSAHPLTRRTYALRSRVRCRICRRRMCGITRAAGTYYACPHDTANPRHAAAVPDHPKTITVREDTLLAVVREFFAEHVLGPHRRDLLAAHLPADPAAQASKTAEQQARLATRLHRIETAQNALVSELETPPAPGDTAAAALRARIRARFAELETERASLTAQAAALDAQTTPADDPSLLDALPITAHRLDQAPAELQHALYQACDLQLLYNRDMHQVTIWVTITDTTPAIITGILNTSEDPTRSDSPQPPIGAENRTVRAAQPSRAGSPRWRRPGPGPPG
jgi:site-specific DNA recombinase